MAGPLKKVSGLFQKPSPEKELKSDFNTGVQARIQSLLTIYKEGRIVKNIEGQTRALSSNDSNLNATQIKIRDAFTQKIMNEIKEKQPELWEALTIREGTQDSSLIKKYLEKCTADDARELLMNEKHAALLENNDTLTRLVT